MTLNDFFQEGGITIDNRQLILSLAVSHQKAQELVKAKKAKEESKDKRNLWLAREGCKCLCSSFDLMLDHSLISLKHYDHSDLINGQ